MNDETVIGLIFIGIFIIVGLFFSGLQFKNQMSKAKARRVGRTVVIEKTTLIAAIVSGVACICCFIWAAILKYCRKIKSLEANQQEDIFNISSRVQGQGQWPTHDTHVPLDHFTLTNEINKYNDDPPTYEEAMSIATSNNNNTVVPAVAPKTSTEPTRPETTTTSGSTSTGTSAAV